MHAFACYRSNISQNTFPEKWILLRDAVLILIISNQNLSFLYNELCKENSQIYNLEV